ncbi:MAG: macro domain-containing protein [Thiohalomonadales bacterium]
MQSQEKYVFEYAGRQLIVSSEVMDSATTEILAVPVSRLLTAERAFTQQIYAAAGDELPRQISQLCREYKEFDIGMAVYTDAGQLPYVALIHAIEQPLQETPESKLIELTYTNSLLLCEFNHWRSITFSRLYPGDDDICANSPARAIIRFWDARLNTSLEKAVLSVPTEEFDKYVSVIEAINLGPLVSGTEKIDNSQSIEIQNQTEVDIHEVALSEKDLMALKDDEEISEWFTSQQK